METFLWVMAGLSALSFLAGLFQSDGERVLAGVVGCVFFTFALAIHYTTLYFAK